MTIDKIIDYIFHTPENTNKAILRAMLKQLIIEHGGNPDEPSPGPDSNHIIYDGGFEE